MATHDGIVLEVKNSTSGNGGRKIVIQSPDGSFQTLYFHLKAINVKAGDEIKEGQEIGELGASAFNKKKGTASHLHYAIKVKNSEGVFEWYDPTEGKGNSVENIVDPQKWIEEKTPSTDEQVQETYSTPDWAKDSVIGGFLYFFLQVMILIFRIK